MVQRVRTPGSAVRERRGKRSARSCAKAAGISPTAWIALENDEHSPTYDTQRGVARALGWPDDWLDYVQAGKPIPDRKPEPARDLEELVNQLSSTVEEMGSLAPDFERLETAVHELTERVVALENRRRRAANG